MVYNYTRNIAITKIITKTIVNIIVDINSNSDN